MYPRVRGVKMNAVDHPFGGAAHHAGKSKSTSRNAPPEEKLVQLLQKEQEGERRIRSDLFEG